MMEDDYIRPFGCLLTIIVVLILWALIIWGVRWAVTQ